MRICTWLRVAACLTAVALCGCAIVDNTDDGSLERFTSSGYISLGFEDFTFLPCNAAEAWWLVWDPSLEVWEKYIEIASQPHEQIFAVFRGERSAPGEYGHLGGYDRTFRVTEIVELRQRVADDCKWPGESQQGGS